MEPTRLTGAVSDADIVAAFAVPSPKPPVRGVRMNRAAQSRIDALNRQKRELEQAQEEARKKEEAAKKRSSRTPVRGSGVRKSVISPRSPSPSEAGSSGSPNLRVLKRQQDAFAAIASRGQGARKSLEASEAKEKQRRGGRSDFNFSQVTPSRNRGMGGGSLTPMITPEESARDSRLVSQYSPLSAGDSRTPKMPAKKKSSKKRNPDPLARSNLVGSSADMRSVAAGAQKETALNVDTRNFLAQTMHFRLLVLRMAAGYKDVDGVYKFHSSHSDGRSVSQLLEIGGQPFRLICDVELGITKVEFFGNGAWISASAGDEALRHCDKMISQAHQNLISGSYEDPKYGKKAIGKNISRVAREIFAYETDPAVIAFILDCMKEHQLLIVDLVGDLFKETLPDEDEGSQGRRLKELARFVGPSLLDKGKGFDNFAGPPLGLAIYDGLVAWAKENNKTLEDYFDGVGYLELLRVGSVNLPPAMYPAPPAIDTAPVSVMPARKKITQEELEERRRLWGEVKVLFDIAEGEEHALSKHKTESFICLNDGVLVTAKCIVGITKKFRVSSVGRVVVDVSVSDNDSRFKEREQLARLKSFGIHYFVATKLRLFKGDAEAAPVEGIADSLTTIAIKIPDASGFEVFLKYGVNGGASFAYLCWGEGDVIGDAIDVTHSLAVLYKMKKIDATALKRCGLEESQAEAIFQSLVAENTRRNPAAAASREDVDLSGMPSVDEIRTQMVEDDTPVRPFRLATIFEDGYDDEDDSDKETETSPTVVGEKVRMRQEKLQQIRSFIGFKGEDKTVNFVKDGKIISIIVKDGRIHFVISNDEENESEVLLENDSFVIDDSSQLEIILGYARDYSIYDMAYSFVGDLDLVGKNDGDELWRLSSDALGIIVELTKGGDNPQFLITYSLGGSKVSLVLAAGKSPGLSYVVLREFESNSDVDVKYLLPLLIASRKCSPAVFGVADDAVDAVINALVREVIEISSQASALGVIDEEDSEVDSGAEDESAAAALSPAAFGGSGGFASPAGFVTPHNRGGDSGAAALRSPSLRSPASVEAARENAADEERKRRVGVLFEDSFESGGVVKLFLDGKEIVITKDGGDQYLVYVDGVQEHSPDLLLYAQYYAFNKMVRHFVGLHGIDTNHIECSSTSELPDGLSKTVVGVAKEGVLLDDETKKYKITYSFYKRSDPDTAVSISHHLTFRATQRGFQNVSLTDDSGSELPLQELFFVFGLTYKGTTFLDKHYDNHLKCFDLKEENVTGIFIGIMNEALGIDPRAFDSDDSRHSLFDGSDDEDMGSSDEEVGRMTAAAAATKPSVPPRAPNQSGRGSQSGGELNVATVADAGVLVAVPVAVPAPAPAPIPVTVPVPAPAPVTVPASPPVPANIRPTPATALASPPVPRRPVDAGSDSDDEFYDARPIPQEEFDEMRLKGKSVKFHSDVSLRVPFFGVGGFFLDVTTPGHLGAAEGGLKSVPFARSSGHAASGFGKMADASASDASGVGSSFLFTPGLFTPGSTVGKQTLFMSKGNSMPSPQPFSLLSPVLAVPPSDVAAAPDIVIVEDDSEEIISLEEAEQETNIVYESLLPGEVLEVRDVVTRRSDNIYESLRIFLFEKSALDQFYKGNQEPYNMRFAELQEINPEKLRLLLLVVLHAVKKHGENWLDFIRNISSADNAELFHVVASDGTSFRMSDLLGIIPAVSAQVAESETMEDNVRKFECFAQGVVNVFDMKGQKFGMKVSVPDQDMEDDDSVAASSGISSSSRALMEKKKQAAAFMTSSSPSQFNKSSLSTDHEIYPEFAHCGAFDIDRAVGRMVSEYGLGTKSVAILAAQSRPGLSLRGGVSGVSAFDSYKVRK